MPFCDKTYVTTQIDAIVRLGSILRIFTDLNNCYEGLCQ